VGEEIFDHMPGRRFERRQHREIPRGDAEDGRRTIVIETGDEDLPSGKPARAVTEDEFASRAEAFRAREAHDALWDGDEPFVTDEHSATGDDPTADAPRDDWSVYDQSLKTDEPAQERQVDEWAAGDEPFAEPAAATSPDEDEFVATSGGQHDTGEFASVAQWQAEGEPPADDDGIVRGGQAGRRTVKIGGRPAEFHGPPARARQRPPRAMHERLGPRPDRVAMWAFALGILLILIAVITGNA
jgi:hypothetical protein